MKVRCAAQTDIGLIRAENEDRYAVVEEHRLYVVADGIGGRAAGATAARLAVDVVVESFATADVMELRRPEQRLVHAVEQANRHVYEAAMWDASKQGMGTTCVAASVQRDCFSVAHVGDSRAYCLRNGVLLQLTRDHSVSEEYRLGLVMEQRLGRRAKALTKALGMRESVEVSVDCRAVVEGDRYLLCSDGITNLVSPITIARILALADTVEDACSSLIEHAKRYGGTDNITAIVLELE